MPDPQMMTEIIIARSGDPEVLVPSRVMVPVPAPDQLLVRVIAAGVNRPDVLQRRGKYPLPKGAHSTPGLEIAGTVEAVGIEVTQFKIGDRVCALTNGGGYAEYCVVPVTQALPWPTGYDAVQAAAIPETYFTVWANLFDIGRVQAGETVLVHGGTSGIGMTVVQLARPFGFQVIATAGSDEKCEVLKRYGAQAINYRQQDFAAAARELTAGRGVDIVLDIIGAAYWSRNVDSLAMDGRLLLIGFLGGAVVEQVDLSKIMSRRITVTGSAMRPRSDAEKARIARALLHQVWPHLGRGLIEPVIHATFPLSDAAAAHRMMESNEHIGKIVLTVGH